jgi:hypothetical protein
MSHLDQYSSLPQKGIKRPNIALVLGVNLLTLFSAWPSGFITLDPESFYRIGYCGLVGLCHGRPGPYVIKLYTAVFVDVGNTISYQV